jgi:hypothetical protein
MVWGQHTYIRSDVPHECLGRLQNKDLQAMTQWARPAIERQHPDTIAAALACRQRHVPADAAVPVLQVHTQRKQIRMDPVP